MGWKRMVHKLCQQGAYAVGIRPVGREDCPFLIKEPSHGAWYADPFVCSDGKHEYVFVELMPTYGLLGKIAVAAVVDGRIGEFHVVIDEPFHLSFPNVFQYGGQWYMLPETNMSGQVRLYCADEFPYRWRLDTILMENVRLVDHALYPVKDGFLMVSHDIVDEIHGYNRIFFLDMGKKTLEELHPAGTWSNIRLGGTFFQKNGKWYHALQDCKECYGEYLHFFEVDTFSSEKFVEHQVGITRVEDICLSVDTSKYQRIHTYNCDSHYEVIDLFFDKMYVDKFFIHQWKEWVKHTR